MFALPFNATVTLPVLILWKWGLARWLEPWATFATAGGAVAIAIGTLGMARTIGLFAKKGEGTLAPWDPPRKLVVFGPYRHVRNPMMLSVGAIVLGTALATNSAALLTYLLVGVLLVPVGVRLIEEPQLVRRFGEGYDEYTRNVPAWVPRLRPWVQASPDREQHEPD